MIGNSIVFIGVIFVVVLFLYLSLRMQAQKSGHHYYNEVYDIGLVQGFAGGDFTVYMNDSIVFDGTINQEPQRIEMKRFAEETSLLIVNKVTEQVSIFELPNDGGTFSFERNDEEISMRE
jgi:hypothetical protein